MEREIWEGLFGPRFARSRSDAPITLSAAERRSPKVVSVPVRFVGSESRRSDAAVKIQKAFRGFAVRKSVRKIAAVRREVDEVEREISRPETAERLRSDGKERLRLSETLMSLLLRLDSVRGVDSGVRDCRKAVIRKAIALQERIDSSAASSSSAGENAEQAAVSDLGDCEESESREPKTDSAPVETKDEREEQATASEAEAEAELIPDSTDSTEARKEDMEIAKPEELNGMEAESPKSGADSDSESECESSSMEAGKAVEEHGEAKVTNGRRSSGELMERVLEDNEKLMGLMDELYERSAAQTRLLSSLSQRVEQLERAFLCEKLRKKKKKQRRGCNSNKSNNCGNRCSQL